MLNMLKQHYLQKIFDGAFCNIKKSSPIKSALIHGATGVNKEKNIGHYIN